MMNVRLFDLTTLLFGVASVNYVAALYGSGRVKHDVSGAMPDV
jgi:hypothetical protein